VEGTIVDKYSGAPAAGLSLRLQSAPYDVPGEAYEGVTDAGGRVVFEGVPGRSSWTYYVKVRQSVGYVAIRLPRQAGDDAIKQRHLQITVPPSDFGTLTLPVPDWAQSNLAPLCQKSTKTAVQPRPEVVVLEKAGDSWGIGWDGTWQARIEGEWKHPWKALVCLDVDYKSAGRYVTTSGTGAGQARRQTIKVKVVQLGTGREYKAKLTALPPNQIAVGAHEKLGASGDATGDLYQWLRELPDH
jgi:hypothetical protein